MTAKSETGYLNDILGRSEELAAEIELLVNMRKPDIEHFTIFEKQNPFVLDESNEPLNIDNLIEENADNITAPQLAETIVQERQLNNLGSLNIGSNESDFATNKLVSEQNEPAFNSPMLPSLLRTTNDDLGNDNVQENSTLQPNFVEIPKIINGNKSELAMNDSNTELAQKENLFDLLVPTIPEQQTVNIIDNILQSGKENFDYSKSINAPNSINNIIEGNYDNHFQSKSEDLGFIERLGSDENSVNIFGVENDETNNYSFPIITSALSNESTLALSETELTTRGHTYNNLDENQENSLLPIGSENFAVDKYDIGNKKETEVFSFDKKASNNQIGNGNQNREKGTEGIGLQKTVNLNKALIENFTILVKDNKEGIGQLKRLVEDVLLEILNGEIINQ